MPGFRVTAIGLLVLAALGLPGLGVNAADSSSAPREARNFLLLYSYGHGGQGVRIFDEGFFPVMAAEGVSATQLFSEHLDLGRHSGDATYVRALRTWIESKYAGRRIDVIVTVQQPALRFLLDELGALAPGAPVVTVQARPPGEAEAGGRRFLSQLAQFDLRGTLERAMELFPETGRIVVVSGASEADRAVAVAATTEAARWKPSVEVETTSDLALDEMLARVAALPPRSIILFTQFNLDRRGRVTLAYEVEAMVTRVANAPVFGLYDFNLANGGIGGSVVGVRALGRATARAAHDVAEGKMKLEGPVTTATNLAAPMFDWEQIARWGGDPTKLPAETTFLNRNPTFWAQYRGYILVAGLALLLQSILIAALVAQRSRRARAEALVRESEAKLQSLTDAIPDPIFMKDREGRLTFANPATLQAMGKSLDQVLGRADAEIYADTRIGRTLSETDAGIMESGVARVLEETVQTPDGYRVYLSTKAPYRSRDGRVVGLVGAARDITERKHAEMLAREKDRSDALHTAIAFLPIGVTVTELDPDGTPRVTTFNSAFKRIVSSNPPSGTPHAEMPEKVFQPDRVTPMAPPDWPGPRAARTGESVQGLELHLRRGDGAWRVLIGSAAPVPGGEPGTRRAVTVLLDVTERVQAEDSLRSTRDYLENLIGYANAPMIVWDPGRRITLFNHAFERMTGYSTAEVMGRDLAMLFPAKTRGESLAMIASTVEGTRWESVEIPIQCKSGEIRLALWNSANVHGPDGVSLQATIAQGQDITDRKRAEAERERLEMAIEQAAETVLITDALGAITYVNPAFEKETGYTREEVLGQNPRILKSGEHGDDFYRELWETIGSGRVWKGRLVNRGKDGRVFTEEATISPVRDATGATVSYVAVKRDITRDLALEAQLLQSQKMEGIGRLAGGVAHDFNNILSVILSCAGFVQNGLRDGDPLREDILEIEKGAKRAAALTRQLLAFSRKQVLQPVSLDLNRVLGEMERMLRRIIGEDVDLVQRLAPDLGLTRADPGQVEQVIMNLVVNARDAMPEGGKLTIVTANVNLDEEYAARHAGSKQGPHVMVAVTDSGVGMDRPTMSRIFEPFFTTKGLGKGSGLGLSTVYGIVKQSGGSVYAYSEIGQGTTFKVFLPLELSPATPEVRAPVSATRGARGGTILVVEDDESIRNIAKRVLVGAGYTVLTAANGGEGLLTCEQHAGEIDLVLTDVVMPQMSGRVFAERLATVRPGMKVLYMSGYTDDAIVHHGVLDPGTQFLGKPFTKVDLLAKVREVLDPGSEG